MVQCRKLRRRTERRRGYSNIGRNNRRAGGETGSKGQETITAVLVHV